MEFKMDQLFGLAGRVALVTGAASGIGEAIAVLFAQSGARVVLADVRRSEVEGNAHQLSSNGFGAIAVVADVRKMEDCASSVNNAIQAYGRLDIVVNNAAVGTQVVGGTVETISPEIWDMTQEVNLRAAYLISGLAMPHMRRGQGGSIINISSSAVFRTDPRRPSHGYAASKGGLLALTRAMAVSFGRDNIRVNAICPGVTRTRLTTDIIDRVERALTEGRGIPLGRVGEPRDIAHAALFLASDASSFITGALMYVDGGAQALSAV
jgi:NAD(P)-dependent dehydrogenase (short-subunit alcohol dehydrogenase family)